ncbi:MAG: hypothetical protein KDD14_15540 [Saprospiraceae bacterium]|nr:hypothetical protein [Saprospiraceae bacterium]
MHFPILSALPFLLLGPLTLTAQNKVRIQVLDYSTDPIRPEQDIRVGLLTGETILEHSNSAGIFELPVGGVQPGDRLELVVTKPGYRLLEPDPYRFIGSVPNRPDGVLHLAILPTVHFDSLRALYKKAIQKRLITAKVDLRQANSELAASLGKQLDVVENNMEQLAELFALTDREPLSDSGRKALALFREKDELTATKALFTEEVPTSPAFAWTSRLKALLLVVDLQIAEANTQIIQALRTGGFQSHDLKNLIAFFVDQGQPDQFLGELPEDVLSVNGTVPYPALWYNSLGLCYKIRRQQAMADQAFNEAFASLRLMKDLGPDKSPVERVEILTNFANSNNKAGNAKQALLALSEAEALIRPLALKFPLAFENALVSVLGGLGTTQAALNRVDIATGAFREALALCNTGMLSGRDDFLIDWFYLFSDIFKFRDSLLQQKDYPALVNLEHIMAESLDSVRFKGEVIVIGAVAEYGRLSWYALFSGDYDLAASAARRCLEFDPEQIWVYTNLGHAQLLSGRLDDAKTAWSHLKGKEERGKSYKTILEEDFLALEAAGIRLPNIKKVRKWLEGWD